MIQENLLQGAIVLLQTVPASSLLLMASLYVAQDWPFQIELTQHVWC